MQYRIRKETALHRERICWARACADEPEQIVYLSFLNTNTTCLETADDLLI